MCANCILFELMKCIDSKYFVFVKTSMCLQKKSDALHTLENIWPKSSNSENHMYKYVFLYNINKIALTDAETETVAYITTAQEQHQSKH